MQMRAHLGALGWAVAGVMTIAAAGTAYAATPTAPTTPPTVAGAHPHHGPHHHHKPPRPPQARGAFPGVNGTYTTHRKTGYVTVDYARGTVASATATALVVKSPDGVSTTFALTSHTTYGAPGHKEIQADLVTGAHVLAVGTGASGSATATHVLVAPTWPAS